MPRNKQARPPTPEVCPVCGDDVPPKALACPECGADHRSGWREDADSAKLPEDDFNYDRFAREEFGGNAKPGGVKSIWWITAIVLLAALIASYFSF